MNKDSIVGLAGLYYKENDFDNAWLGWFGIKAEERRRHLGSLAIALFEEEARRRGYRYARLFTDRFHNETAVAFYHSQGYVDEIYESDEDPASKIYHLLIFSKSLHENDPVDKWNNRIIHFTEQVAKQ